MRDRKLNKNKKMHWGNWFEENFALLKVPSLKVFVFKRVSTNVFVQLPTFGVKSLRPSNFFGLNLLWSLWTRSSGAPQKVELKMFCLASNFWCWKLEAKQNYFASTFYGALEHEDQEFHERLSSNLEGWRNIELKFGALEKG